MQVNKWTRPCGGRRTNSSSLLSSRATTGETGGIPKQSPQVTQPSLTNNQQSPITNQETTTKNQQSPTVNQQSSNTIHKQGVPRYRLVCPVPPRCDAAAKRPVVLLRRPDRQTGQSRRKTATGLIASADIIRKRRHSGTASPQAATSTKPVGRIVCPLCGLEFVSTGALASHTQVAHNTSRHAAEQPSKSKHATIIKFFK